MILFTADWHIKLGQKNVPKDWAVRRYIDFFNQVHAIECDMHIIGGDVFDRVPSMEELELYFEFVSGVRVPTIIYDGNHEATRKNSTFFSYLTKATKNLNQYVTIVDQTTQYSTHIILPYCDLHKKDIFDTLPPLPLFTHVRGEIPPHVKSEIDLSNLDKFPIVFAGDLHAHSNSQRNIVYPGSPMTTSFHRNEVKTGYILIDNNWGWQWKEFNLPQLIRKTVNNTEDMVASPYHHTIYEIEGNLQELSEVKNSELLDKKIIKRSSDTALILSKDMTILEELVEYLIYILEIEDVTNIVSTYNDYSSKT